MSEESEENEKITAKNWNKLYRLDEHDGNDIDYDSYTGEYYIQYHPERFTTHEGLNYTIGVWKESENKTWLIGQLDGTTVNGDSSTLHSEIVKMIESDNPLRTMTKMFGIKRSHYDLVERKRKTTYSFNVETIPPLKRISYARLAYTLRFFKIRAGLENDDDLDGLKLVLLCDCMQRNDSETPAEIDRASQAAVKIIHIFGDASQYMSVIDNIVHLTLTRTGLVTTKINMKDNYKEFNYSGEKLMREKENKIIEGVI